MLIRIGKRKSVNNKNNAMLEQDTADNFLFLTWEVLFCCIDGKEDLLLISIVTTHMGYKLCSTLSDHLSNVLQLITISKDTHFCHSHT